MSICKICFKEIPEHGFHSTLDRNAGICQHCFNEWNPVWYAQKIDGIETLSIYFYDETVKSMLFQFKGCFDKELGSVFFERQKAILKLLYHGYLLVPLPSSKEDDEIRGFNHVEEMFSCLQLPMEKILYKRIRYKQSELSREERENAKEKIGIRNPEKIKGRKILIVDDVITTGSSIRAAVALVRSGKPKKIKILTCAFNKKQKTARF